MTFFALEWGGKEFSIIARTTLRDLSADDPFEFKMRDDVGEVFSVQAGRGVRYDFAARHGMIVHKRMWVKHPAAKPEPASGAPAPTSIGGVRKCFFSVRKGLFRRPTWKTFTIKDPDDDWTGCDNPESRAAFLVLSDDGEHIVHACLGGDAPPIVGSFRLPPSMRHRYPLKIKIGFSGNTGAVSIDDERLVGLFDFRTLDCEVIESHHWESVGI